MTDAYRPLGGNTPTAAVAQSRNAEIALYLGTVAAAAARRARHAWVWLHAVS